MYKYLYISLILPLVVSPLFSRWLLAKRLSPLSLSFLDLSNHSIEPTSGILEVTLLICSFL